MLWSGANDGPVHVSRDDGKTWTNVTPKDLPAGGRVQQIDPSPHRKGSAYIAYYRYLLGDWAPYVYRTDDYGKTWTRLTDGRNGIPGETPVRVVREDPDRAGLLYAGTEFGMYLSWDNGAHWQRWQLDLPVTPITDMRLHRQDLVIATMGRGFWILDDVTRLHQWKTAPATATLFAPREATRARLAVSAATSKTPEYPGAVASIDYVLPADAASVSITIVDAAGKELRTFTSSASSALGSGHPRRACAAQAAAALAQWLRVARAARTGSSGTSDFPGCRRQAIPRVVRLARSSCPVRTRYASPSMTRWRVRSRCGYALTRVSSPMESHRPISRRSSSC